jgi:hypothetical protein
MRAGALMTKNFCHCIKKVRKSIRLRKGNSNKLSAAIATCTKSVLQTKGVTLKKVNCNSKPHLLSVQRKKTLKTNRNK